MKIKLRKKWWITPLTLALLVLAVLAAAAVIRWVTPRDYEQPYPDEGVYYCEQLDMYFTFAYRDISVPGCVHMYRVF